MNGKHIISVAIALIIVDGKIYGAASEDRAIRPPARPAFTSERLFEWSMPRFSGQGDEEVPFLIEGIQTTYVGDAAIRSHLRERIPRSVVYSHTSITNEHQVLRVYRFQNRIRPSGTPSQYSSRTDWYDVATLRHLPDCGLWRFVSDSGEYREGSLSRNITDNIRLSDLIAGKTWWRDLQLGTGMLTFQYEESSEIGAFVEGRIISDKREGIWWTIKRSGDLIRYNYCGNELNGLQLAWHAEGANVGPTLNIYDAGNPLGYVWWDATGRMTKMSEGLSIIGVQEVLALELEDAREASP